jgi:hypothetical protein
MISTALRRLSPAVSLVALFIALLALVAAAAGAGYAGGTVGAKDLKKNSVTAAKIKKNAVTTKKIKNNAVNGAKIADGSVGIADLPAEEAQHAVQFSNGGEGDCVWQGGGALIPGLSSPTFRKDRFGTVHLTGILVGSNGAGGDGACDSGAPGQASDIIAFMLPAGYIPAKTVIVPGSVSGTGGAGAIIVGAAGLVSGTISLPPGAVAADSDGALLDGVYFQPAGSGVVLPKIPASGKVSGGMGRMLGLN